MDKIDIAGPSGSSSYEKELRKTISRLQYGDRKAIDELKRSHMRFVISMAKQYEGKGLTRDELLKAGEEGLIYAAKNFDTDSKFKFICWALWWIRNNIKIAFLTHHE